MANLFLIPKSPIANQTIQSTNPPPGNGLPSFGGYGLPGGLSRFRDFLPSFRDPDKAHPAQFGNRKGGIITADNRAGMKISTRFIGNFLIAGVTHSNSGSPLGGATVKLFRTVDDVCVAQTTSDANGKFTFSLPNDSYKAYYISAYLAGNPNVVGITDNSLVTVNG
jgi:hypothetical protein